MAELAPPQVVQQPQLVPPTVGLLTSANVVEETDERWVNGFAYAPEGCGAGEVFDLCATFTKTVAGAAPPVTGTPYGLVAQDTCTTFSHLERDYVARATRKLLAIETFLLERELWSDTLGLNPHLADAGNAEFVDATGSSPSDLRLAIADLEQAALDCMPGRRVMLHVRPWVLNAILGATGSSALIRFDGTRYYTPSNNLVVPGRGYPGTSPAGAEPSTSEWIYASTMVDVRHGPVFTTPSTLREATNRQTNQVTYFAERAAHASFDYDCCVVGLEVSRTLS
jgi:hypothetical protein